MKILIGGSGGLIGTALSERLVARGEVVHRLVRTPPVDDRSITWDPAAGQLDPAAIEGFDAIIHLGGADVAGGRWTDTRKRIIADSRIGSTGLLARAIAAADTPPSSFLVASAIGYYGDRGDQILDEDSPEGEGFLPDVCRRWEEAAAPAVEAGVRVAHLRFGIVLSPEGGALQKMLMPFRLGLGGVVGSGRQYWSWIGLDDAVAAIDHIVRTPSLTGPINITAPEPVTCRVFTKALGRALGRPTILPLPAVAARLALGRMADETLLASARVEPRRLLDHGFEFESPDLGNTLQRLLEH